MGTITVVVEDEVEEKFRERAMQKFGKRKGCLGKAVTQAMSNWAESEGDNATEETLKMLKEGFDMGRLKFKSREELHER